MENRGGMDDIISWAQGVLRGAAEAAPVAETPYSLVLKLTRGGEVFYLKKTPPPLFIEAAVLRFLRGACGIGCVPDVIAENAALGCFLMKSCGGESLRALFAREGFDGALFLQGAENCRAVQRATEKHVPRLLDMGVPDWRLPRLPLLYAEAVRDGEFLARCGMTAEQAARLGALEGEFEGLCAALAAFGLPDALNHSDFQENNMLTGDAVSIIDWGEVSVGNPLLPLEKALGSVGWRNGLDPAARDALAERVYGGFVSAPEDRARARAAAGRLSPVYYIFTLRELERLTRRTSPVWNGRMKDAFGAFLRGAAA